MINNSVGLLVEVDNGEVLTCEAYERPAPKPEDIFDYRYFPGIKFVTESDSQVHTVQGFDDCAEGSFITTTNSKRFLEKACRPATLKEQSQRYKFTEEGLGECGELLRALLSNPKNYMLLDRQVNGLDAIMNLDVHPIKKLILCESILHKINNNNCSSFINYEIGFAKRIDRDTYSDYAVCTVLPFVHAISRSMDVMGHSGFSHGIYVNLIVHIIKTAKKRMINSGEKLLSWKRLHEIEVEECKFDDNEPKNYIFDPVLEPSTLLRQVPTIPLELVDLFTHVCNKGLRNENIVPLTLEDDEWFDHGYVIQNKRNGEVFKKDKDSTPYYRGILMCDNTQTFRGFFSSKECRLDLKPNSELAEYCVYLNYGFEVEPGTTPDGSLKQYAYIPPRIEMIIGETEIRKWDGSMYTFAGSDSAGNVFMKRGDSSSVVTKAEFLETDSINGMVYPKWLALPKDLPIEFLD